MDYKDKINILIQGPVDEVSLEALDYYNSLANVVISYWDDAVIPEEYQGKAWKELGTPEPNIEALVKAGTIKEHWKGTTFYYALTSMYRGLAECDKELVVKVRSDERYLNLVPIIDRLIEKPDKVFCGNIFHRNDYQGGFHMGDHLIACKTKDLRIACRMAMRIFKPGNCPEVTLAKALLLTKREIVTPGNFNRMVKAVDINELGDYIAQWQHADIVYDSTNEKAIFNPSDCEVID